MTVMLVALAVFGVNLALSGDNAVLIASILAGAPTGAQPLVAVSAGLAAIGLVAATLLASKWMRLPMLQLAGGAFVLWVAVTLFRDASATGFPRPGRMGVSALIGRIVFAEVAMSIDNIFAVAAIAKSDAAAVALGLAPSVLVVVCASRFLAGVLERFPALTLVIAGVLGGVAAEMIMTDPVVETVWKAGPGTREAVRTITALAAMTFGGLVWLRGRAARR